MKEGNNQAELGGSRVVYTQGGEEVAGVDSLDL